MKLIAIVNNLPANIAQYTHIVARPVDGELWFYGAWNDREGAEAQAREVEGVVLEVKLDA